MRSIGWRRRALLLREWLLVCGISSGDWERDAKVVCRIDLGLEFLDQFALRLIVICKVGKVERIGPVPACRRRRTETEARRKLRGSYLVVLRTKIMIWRRGIIAVRLG